MKILVVDDNKKDLDRLRSRILNYGFDEIYISDEIGQAVKILNEEKPHLILCDYLLKNDENCLSLFAKAKIPNYASVIIVTDYFKETIFNKIKEQIPAQFLSKACSDLELKTAIEYAKNMVDRLEEKGTELKKLFVRIGDKAKVIGLDEILYFEVEGKYLNIYVENRKYSIRSSLSSILKILPSKFLRTHGSYVVNCDKIEEIMVLEQSIKLGDKTVPFTRGFRKELMDRFYFT